MSTGRFKPASHAEARQNFWQVFLFFASACVWNEFVSFSIVMISCGLAMVLRRVFKGILAVCLLVLLGPAARDAACKGQSRMVFEPGAKQPTIHTGQDDKTTASAEVKPAENAQSKDSAQEVTVSPTPAVEHMLQQPPSVPKNMPAEIGRILDGFFGLLVKGNIDVAYTTLTKGTVLEREPNTLTSLKASTNEALKLFGAFVGYEILGVEEVGSHMLRVSCVSLGEKFPLSWKFFYYRPDGDWRLIDIRVGAALNEFFPERPIESKSASRSTLENK